MIPNLYNSINSICQFWQDRQAILLTPDFGPSSTGLINELRNVGAKVLAVICGSATSPDYSQIPNVFCASDYGEKLDRNSFECWLLQDNPELRRWLDGIDPDKKSQIIGTVFTESPEIFDREVHGWRPPEWAKWEDKTEIDARLMAIGVATPRSKVLSINDPRLSQWPYYIDQGYGLIVARDSVAGYVGDAQQLRWVTSELQLSKTIAEFRDKANKVRVAQFVPGVPCSILGLVAETGVAVFDPIEIITLRSHGTRCLLFCGSSNRWRPQNEEIMQMRNFTLKVGEELFYADGYRGIYSVDGVLTTSGFLATEVNPRHASGMGLRECWPEFPIYLFSRAVRHGIPGMENLSVDEVERTIRQATRAQPSHNIRLPVSESCSQKFSSGKLQLTGLGEIKQTILAKRTHESIQLIQASPETEHNLLSPAAAALARATIDAGAFCFVDDHKILSG